MTDSFDFHALPRAYGALSARATFRQLPEDFVVEEQLDASEQDAGEHLWLKIKKRDQNTQWVAGLLARAAGVKRQDVSFAGLKDRYAVTTQWFSIYLPKSHPTAEQLQYPDYQILDMLRQPKKLRRGTHSGNRFRILLRDFQGDQEKVNARLEQIVRDGVPNYFAEQRFGHDGNNLHEAQRLIEQNRLKGNRQGSGMALSAARAWLFNQVLAARVSDGSWSSPMTDETVAEGPLWGRGRSVAVPAVREFEQQLLADWQSWCYALEHAGLSQERRSLQLLPQNLFWQWLPEGDLQLDFALQSGQFATALLREVCELFRPSREGL